MNKYLEKIAGLPITAKNVSLAAKSFTQKGLDFSRKAQAGKAGARDIMELGGRAQRLNKNLPAHLQDAFQKAQVDYATKAVA